MQMIKLDATESTNLYLKDLITKRKLKDFTVVTCKHQVKGKGQRGNSWISESGKNLTVSILKHFSAFDMARIFYLNFAVSLAILEALKEFEIPGLMVKWPNDIMSGNQKICGILVETVLKGGQLRHAILGFGLNVNQTKFEHLPQATSLKNITSLDYDLDKVLQKVVTQLQHFMKNIEQQTAQLHVAYENVLFKKNTPATFIPTEGNHFLGIIDGISEDGKLLVTHEDGTAMAFYHKEVQLVY